MIETFMASITVDVDSFFNCGLEASITVGGATVKCIYDNEWVSEYVDGQQVNTTGPRAVIRSADIGTAVIGSSVTVNALTKTIIDIQPDGTGITTLVLE